MFTIFLAAVLPALILFWYVYSRDINPEPTNLVFKGFLFGGISTFVSTMISGPLMTMGLFSQEPTTVLESVKTAFFGAAIPEETAKLLAVGLGFATFENLLYVLSAGAGWFAVSVSRAFLAVPGHFAFAVVMGYYYSRQHFSWDLKEKSSARWKMWLYPVLLHGTYDTICFVSNLSESLNLILTFCLLWFCWRLFRHTRNRIIAEAADNASESGYYADHRDFYADSRSRGNGGGFIFGGRDLFGRDIEYYYKDGDDSVDEQ